MKKIKTEILILGGGWSGLIAAYLLSSKKRDVVILEKEPVLGGLARTFDFKGFKFDIGGHRLFFKNGENIKFVKNIINNSALLFMKRKSKIFFDDTYINYPLDFYSILKINKKYLIKTLFNIFYLRKQFKQENFEDWVKANYGITLYDIIFKDYTEKVWGKSCKELSSSWASKRIGKVSLFNFFKDTFMCDDSPKEKAHYFHFPREGIGHLIESLEQKLKDTCRIYKQIQLEKFLARDNKLNSLYFTLNGYPIEISFKYVFSSIPVIELLKIIPRHLESEFLNVEAEIQYRSLIMVSIVVNKKYISNWHWCYFPSKEVIFSRIYQPKFWSKAMVADDKKTLVCAEIFCNYGDSYWIMDENDLLEYVKKGLRRAGLIGCNDIISDIFTIKIKYAYPLLQCGVERYLNSINKMLNSFKNLRLIGRSGTHSYFDMEECLNDVKGRTKFLCT